ncbi:class I SAM-dependent methyltransferase [Salinirubellus salinus]|jgi:ubiquinone/menaquinone biosynthesis C-methylase UbiE|uniref:Class I SAM-dependent methyltransferase n=1 Tax=Salinirubellus salinus TaxID=1364945 RepID=A0A9E7UBD0_9EURY|nr:class I SAM-dependent methyltransferase [Salinirubellus salinus]UWM55068.1 class I SAM-dependent methyltransferase [Salinirubellus salinus]
MDDGAREGHRTTVQRGYDALAGRYDEQRSGAGRGGELVRELGATLPPDSRILDAGCGAGVPVAATLSERHRVVGLDLSRGMLDRAAANVPAARLVQGDLTRLPFADGAFDALVSYYAVIHVPREEHDTVFAEFARVLRPGGRALLVLGSADWEGENDDWQEWGEPMRWSFWGPERNRELLAAAGFDLVDAETVDDELGGTFEHVTVRRP